MMPFIMHPPVISSLLGPNILPGMLFSGTLMQYASFWARDFYILTTTDKIIVLYFKFFREVMGRQKILN
jgi:hypothetical protein